MQSRRKYAAAAAVDKGGHQRFVWVCMSYHTHFITAEGEEKRELGGWWWREGGREGRLGGLVNHTITLGTSLGFLLNTDVPSL